MPTTKIHRNAHEAALPPIKLTADELQRLNALADSSMELFPRVAHFLAREMERAHRSVSSAGCQRRFPVCPSEYRPG